MEARPWSLEKGEAMSKLQDALKVRQGIIDKLSSDGRFTKTNIGNVLSWSNDELEVIYRTPFTPVVKQTRQPVHVPLGYYKALIKQHGGHVGENLEYGLNVWVKGKGKVLNIEWSEADRKIYLIRFNHGGWEQIFDDVR
jgi:hypothetical protein